MTVNFYFLALVSKYLYTRANQVTAGNHIDAFEIKYWTGSSKTNCKPR